MKASLIDKLCCPFDRQDLNLKVFVRNEAGDILEGLLTCPHCKRYFPVIYGIPVMTPDEYREKALEQPIVQRWLPDHRREGFMLDE